MAAITNTMFREKRLIARRVRFLCVLIFSISAVLLIALTYLNVRGVSRQVSKNYALLYANAAASTFSSYISRELVLMEKAAHSNVFTQWFSDENDPEKMRRAYAEMADMADILHSEHVHVVVAGSLNEYETGEETPAGDMKPVSTLDAGNPGDRWFFECAESEYDYLLSVDTDMDLEKKYVWINYKVMRNGELLGIFGAGIKFSALIADEKYSFICYFESCLTSLAILQAFVMLSHLR